MAPAVKQAGVEYITGVGHGSYDTFTGDWYDPIFRIGSYSPTEVNPKIVHFLSCETARDLGPDFVKNGCSAYLGYDEDFSYEPDSSDLFFACDSEIDLAFADGQSARRAYDRAVAAFTSRASAAKAAGKLYTAALFEFNRDHLCAPSTGAPWGDPGARLV